MRIPSWPWEEIRWFKEEKKGNDQAARLFEEGKGQGFYRLSRGEEGLVAGKGEFGMHNVLHVAVGHTQRAVFLFPLVRRAASFLACAWVGGEGSEMGVFGETCEVGGGVSGVGEVA